MIELTFLQIAFTCSMLLSSNSSNSEPALGAPCSLMRKVGTYVQALMNGALIMFQTGADLACSCTK
eukprot:scaffold45363_cov18-Tisochrysis_lutea.AAC.2